MAHADAQCLWLRASLELESPLQVNRFSDPESESALLGYVATNGFEKIPEHEIPVPADFTDERWTLIYRVAHAQHRQGMVPSHLSITGALRDLQHDLAEKFLSGWEDWHLSTDRSLQFSPRTVVEACRSIRRCAQKRAGVQVGQTLIDGGIDAQEERRAGAF